MSTTKPKDIDVYISGFPIDVQKVLQEIRATIKKTVPGAAETISYGIPAFNLNKTYLVYFAAFKNHIGFYPAPVAMEAFKEDFSPYRTGKGSIQFPLNKPMPFDLITKIVKFRVNENLIKAKKKQLKICPRGHRYYKSTDCPTCPKCEAERKPKESIFSLISAPARRALEGEGITDLEKLSEFTEKEILQLHGMGPSTIPKLKSALSSKGLDFKKTESY